MGEWAFEHRGGGGGREIKKRRLAETRNTEEQRLEGREGHRDSE